MRTVAAIAFATIAGPSFAFTPAVGTAVCPIDGRKFEYPSFASYSTWGRRLDGKPVGSGVFPATLPLCPGSKFPAYKDFKKEEIAKAKQMISTPDYKRVVALETDYKILSYVMRQLAEPARNTTYVALQATWEAEGDKAKYSRYASDYVREADDFVKTIVSTSEEWWPIQTITLDVVRQTGDFDAARKRLTALRAASPRTQVITVLDLEAKLISERNDKPYEPPNPFQQKSTAPAT